MRYISFTVASTSTFTVDGFHSFPGEICNEIAKLIWGGVEPSESDFRRTYNLVWAVVYDGNLSLGWGNLTTSEMSMLIDFREWLQRLETNELSAHESVHILGNMNAGFVLAFKAESDND